MWRFLSEEILRGKQTLGTYQAPGRSVARAFAAQRTKRETFSARPNCFASGVVRVHVVIENLDELGDDFVAFRSEEHTSELQSHSDLVCRLLLEKKKTNQGR